MNAFRRILDTAGLNSGELIPLEGNRPTYYPTINRRSMGNALERFMYNQGAIQRPPASLTFTRNASGACVPICAAEITLTRVVRWTYLMHGHGGNMPINLAAAAKNPAHVYVCMLVYSGASSSWAAQNLQNAYFQALDPLNLIPNANALLIYGNHTTLAISRQAMIAVNIVA